MPGLLRHLTEDDPLDAPRTQMLLIGGEAYANAAAKFWPGLIDELDEFFPACTLIELSAPSSGKLEPDLLFPEKALQRHLDAMDHADTADTWREALAELDLLGPPGPVHARLFRGKEEMLVRSLPLESVDTETFAYLLAWQFKWAGIPSGRWNDTRLSGVVIGKDPVRRRVYRMTFSLAGTPLPEGLVSRALSIVPSVKGLFPR